MVDRNNDSDANSRFELMIGVVLAIIGDSPAPSLALVNSNIAQKYIFLYTAEMKENADLLEGYLTEKSPELLVEMHPLPSMNAPSEIVNSARNFVSELNQEVHSAIFLTSGAKQVTLPFYIHAPWLTRIFLKESRGENQSPSILVIKKPDGSERIEPTNTSLAEMLAIRGWEMKNSTEFSGLVKGNQYLSNINAEYNEKFGRLIFYADSYVKLNPLRKTTTPRQKKKMLSFDHDSIGQLVILSESFGRNGATYSIRGDLGRKVRNVVPYFIRHDRDFNEEEE